MGSSGAEDAQLDWLVLCILSSKDLQGKLFHYLSFLQAGTFNFWLDRTILEWFYIQYLFLLWFITLICQQVLCDNLVMKMKSICVWNEAKCSTTFYVLFASNRLMKTEKSLLKNFKNPNSLKFFNTFRRFLQSKNFLICSFSWKNSHKTLEEPNKKAAHWNKRKRKQHSVKNLAWHRSGVFFFWIILRGIPVPCPIAYFQSDSVLWPLISTVKI